MRSGDPCPRCPTGRLLTVHTTRLRGTDLAKRYLKCACGNKGVEIVTAGPPQRRRKPASSLEASHLGTARRRGKMKTSPSTRDEVSPVAELLTLQQLAERLDTDFPTVLALVRDGHLPMPTIIGDRLVRWSSADVAAWMGMGCPSAEPPSRRDFYGFQRLHWAEQKAKDEFAFQLLNERDNECD